MGIGRDDGFSRFLWAGGRRGMFLQPFGLQRCMHDLSDCKDSRISVYIELISYKNYLIIVFIFLDRGGGCPRSRGWLVGQ